MATQPEINIISERIYNLYNSILNINKIYYLPCWILFMDLVETQGNPEDYYFYNWESLLSHYKFYNLHTYKRNFEDNINIILKIVLECVIDITNNTDNYTVDNDEVLLDLGLIKCKDCNNIINTYGYCNC
jgi:hypothetical protein